MDSGAPRWPDRLYETAALVAREKRQIDLILDESWPVEGKTEEQQARQAMKRGEGVAVDDAFARMAGVGKEDWLRQVEQHKQRTAPSRMEKDTA